MQVYVITKGCYSDYHICGVTDNKDKAEFLVEKYSNNWGEAQIEVYDTELSNKMLEYSYMYYAYYSFKTKELRVCETDFDTYNELLGTVKRGKDFLYMYLGGATREQAFKIASDAFAKYRAEHLDI